MKLVMKFLAALTCASAAFAQPRLAPPDTMTVRVPMGSGTIYRTPTQATPPVQPQNIINERDYQEREGQLKEPFLNQPGPVRFSPVAPTNTDTFNRAPETFTVLRSSTVAPGAPNGSVSNVAEPGIAVKGNAIFETYNWFSSISTDNGVTRRFISPYSAFPLTPTPFTGGFCCDQRASQASKKGLVFWFLQYIKNGSTATSTGGVRLAVAKDNALNSDPIPWQTYDFSPEQLNLTGVWFDFPHLQVSDNYVYFTSNMFSTAADAFSGAAIYRIPLAAIINNQPFTADTFVTTTFGSILAINGSGGEGTRASKNTMYFASFTGSTSVRILKWPEADAQPTAATITTPSTTNFSGLFTCTAPDSTNPCGRANSRMQTGWVTDTELGMMWSSNTIAPSRPFPFTRVLILNPDTLAVISEPDIFSTTSALLYPAVAVNQRGHLGGIIDSLGGDQSTTVRAFIRDDLSPDLTTAGWETFLVSAGNAGAPARWGDYNGIAAHARFPNTWLGLGHNQVDGTGNANARIRSVWFSRERDATAQVNTVISGTGSATITSVPAGVNCNGTTGCSANFPLGTSVTLTIAPAVGTTLLRWGGACYSEGLTCTVLADDLRNVSAKIADGVFIATGFEDR
jgi:hypothetical protein